MSSLCKQLLPLLTPFSSTLSTCTRSGSSLFCSWTDWLPLHTHRWKTKFSRVSRASPCPASCSHPRRLREEAPASPELLLAIRVLLTPWLWSHPLQSRDSPAALQGWSRSPRAFRGLWLWLCAPGDSLGGHQMKQIPSTEKLCQPCANGRKERKEVLLLHFFVVISAESKKKKRAPGLEGRES